MLLYFFLLEIKPWYLLNSIELKIVLNNSIEKLNFTAFIKIMGQKVLHISHWQVFRSSLFFFFSFFFPVSFDLTVMLFNPCKSNVIYGIILLVTKHFLILPKDDYNSCFHKNRRLYNKLMCSSYTIYVK